VLTVGIVWRGTSEFHEAESLTSPGWIVLRTVEGKCGLNCRWWFSFGLCIWYHYVFHVFLFNDIYFSRGKHLVLRQRGWASIRATFGVKL